MSSSRRRLTLSSPARTPLDDDDLLSEILLRLPPQPSSLPRASLVSKRWRQLVSDPGFFRRFRLHHRSNPPLIGLFRRNEALSFLPTLEASNRVPPDRFSLERHDLIRSLGCRHGLLLIHLMKLFEVMVWDPVTAEQHRIAIPPAFANKKSLINGAVLSPAGEDQHFQVVLVVAAEGDEEQRGHVLACVYSSKAGSWGNLISMPLPYQVTEIPISTMFFTGDAVLAGGCLYWMLCSNFVGILEFDLERQSLAVIRAPNCMYVQGNYLRVMRAKGGGLGFLFVSSSDNTTKLFERTTDCDGVASWGLARTIELDKLLSLKPEEKGSIFFLGYAEENNVVFLWTTVGPLMIHLESLKFKKLFGTRGYVFFHPFESVYAAGVRVGGGHNEAELLLNT